MDKGKKKFLEHKEMVLRPLEKPGSEAFSAAKSESIQVLPLQKPCLPTELIIIAHLMVGVARAHQLQTNELHQRATDARILTVREDTHTIHEHRQHNQDMSNMIMTLDEVDIPELDNNHQHHQVDISSVTLPNQPIHTFISNSYDTFEEESSNEVGVVETRDEEEVTRDVPATEMQEEQVTREVPATEIQEENIIREVPAAELQEKICCKRKCLIDKYQVSNNLLKEGLKRQRRSRGEARRAASIGNVDFTFNPLRLHPSLYVNSDVGGQQEDRIYEEGESSRIRDAAGEKELGEGSRIRDATGEEELGEGSRIRDATGEEELGEGSRIRDFTGEEELGEGSRIRDATGEEELGEGSRIRDATGEEELGESSRIRDGAGEEELGEGRALAHHLKETSPSTSGDLSLSKILAGNTRNLAARLFYETPVLKSKGLIDVQQDQPYGDIILKMMPAFFSKKFD